MASAPPRAWAALSAVNVIRMIVASGITVASRLSRRSAALNPRSWATRTATTWEVAICASVTPSSRPDAERWALKGSVEMTLMLTSVRAV